MPQLDLTVPSPSTIGLALVWLVLMLAYSPLADRIGSRLVRKQPNLGVFRILQQSKSKLVVGIGIAWFLSLLEELVFRGILLLWVEGFLWTFWNELLAIGVAVFFAAIWASIIHLYQGLRAAIIVAQLSVLFGLLFVLSGYNLWAVVLCHGLYDTIAFIRFANKKSKYSILEGVDQAA